MFKYAIVAYIFYNGFVDYWASNQIYEMRLSAVPFIAKPKFYSYPELNATVNHITTVVENIYDRNVWNTFLQEKSSQTFIAGEYIYRYSNFPTFKDKISLCAHKKTLHSFFMKVKNRSKLFIDIDGKCLLKEEFTIFKIIPIVISYTGSVSKDMKKIIWDKRTIQMPFGKLETWAEDSEYVRKKNMNLRHLRKGLYVLENDNKIKYAYEYHCPYSL